MKAEDSKTSFPLKSNPVHAWEAKEPAPWSCHYCDLRGTREKPSRCLHQAPETWIQFGEKLTPQGCPDSPSPGDGSGCCGMGTPGSRRCLARGERSCPEPGHSPLLLHGGAVFPFVAFPKERVHRVPGTAPAALRLLLPRRRPQPLRRHRAGPRGKAGTGLHHLLPASCLPLPAPSRSILPQHPPRPPPALPGFQEGFGGAQRSRFQPYLKGAPVGLDSPKMRVGQP